MIIRPADIDDALAIATIHVRSWQNAYTGILPEDGLAALSIEERTKYWVGILQNEENPTHVLLAEADSAIVGFSSWGQDTEEGALPTAAILFSIYMRPESMGKGYGSELLEATEVEMIASGIEVVTLWVLAENAASRQFYERNGWQLEPHTEQEREFFNMQMRIVRYRKIFR